MAIDKKKLAQNLQSIRKRIAAACARAGRDEREVTLVAITKAADLEDIQELVRLGQAELGESRVQQLSERAAELAQWAATQDKLPAAKDIRWHMVGRLQRNKVKSCLEAARVIQSVDSLRLAEEISLRAQRASVEVDCLMEVNCSNEPQKGGVAVGAASHLAEQISTLKNIRLSGLMTMAPLVEDPQQTRPAFVRIRELFEEMRKDRIGGKAMRHLSMGMSNDFEVAIEEGATMVRIGSALFEA